MGRVQSALMDEDLRQSPSPGTLYVVATPIGHLGDLSPRAGALLGSVDRIAAEDTRVSQRLPGVEGRGRLVSVNEHSERQQIGQLLDALAAGQSVALVSDAGTPLVSDPGYRLVAAAHDRGLAVSPIPGPCAAIAALSVAGLPSDRFFFEGFLPARAAARRQRLSALAEQTATLIIYVPARDLKAVLGDLQSVLGDRQACLARELTKRFETVRRAALSQLLDFVIADPDQARGEAVLVVAGAEAAVDRVSIDALARELAEALPPSQAAGLLARVSGLSRRQAWQRVAGNNSEVGEPSP